MKTQVNSTMFIEAFHVLNRFYLFGYEALEELFNHIKELEQDIGEEFELDVIALCCDWSVMTREEILEQYSDDLDLYPSDKDISNESYALEMNTRDFVEEVQNQLDTYCYDLSDGSYLVCTAMI